MLLLVFVVLLGTVVTVNSAPPDVKIFTSVFQNGHVTLTCRAKGFITSDVILNIKKNHCVLTKEDGVETSGVKPENNTYWRRDHVTILKSEVSNYSCEVVHAASRFRVEKVWDPDSVGGRIISSKFIDTTPPDVKIFPEISEVQTNVILTCLVSGFYPNNIILNMKRNGRILTREDGVKSSGVRPNEDDTFQRRDSVEIKRSDKSDYSCEVIHDASGSRVEKVWDHRLPSGSDGDTVVIIGAGVGGLVLVLVLVVVAVLLVLKKRGVLGAGTNDDAKAPTKVVVDPPPGGNVVNVPLLDGTNESKTSLNSDNSSDSGVEGSIRFQSGSSTPSADAVSRALLSSAPDRDNDEAENS